MQGSSLYRSARAFVEDVDFAEDDEDIVDDNVERAVRFGAYLVIDIAESLSRIADAMDPAGPLKDRVTKARD